MKEWSISLFGKGRIIFLLILFFTTGITNGQSEVDEAIEQANHELWGKFVDKYGVINDFVGEIPTAFDCKLSRPNAFGWWTPIENGAFFNGLYLIAACERAKLTDSEMDKDKARVIAQGLLKLSLVSDVPGFISRGISLDGKTHYPNGSNDQTIPWFYGLYHYLKTDIPAPREREIIRSKLIEVVNAVKQNNWGFPSDGMFTGGFRDNLKDYRFLEAPCYLMLLRCMFEITNDTNWLNRYKIALSELPEEGTKTRAEICSEGIGYTADHEVWGDRRDYLWVYVIKQMCLVELARIETDQSIRSFYNTGINQNRQFVLEFAEEYTKFDNHDTKFYGNKNWRVCYTEWYPQFTVEDAITISKIRNEDIIGERKAYERTFATTPLAAAAIIALVGNPKDCTLLDQVLSHYDYSKLNLGEFFFAEFAYYLRQCN